MKYNKRFIWIPLILAVAFAAGMWVNYFMNRQPDLTDGQKKFNSIISTIEGQYVDEVDIDSLIERVLPHLLSNLDPHSAYIPAKDLREVNDELEGSFSGVGVSFSIMNDTICIVEVISGGPSEKVGLKAGDRIVTIDGENVAGVGITNQDVYSRLRGLKDSLVKLGIKRNGARGILDYEVIRGDIPVSSIDAAYLVEDGVGYVKVNKFSRNTYDEFISALNMLRLGGAEKYIIDLRGNTGGFMEVAVRMANEFLPGGREIVETRGRDKEINSVVISDGYGRFKNSEVVVLIDEFSASSSEILAGALQDNDRGLIIGRRSFGKGLVQQQLMMPDSSALRLTVQRYYTPSGRSIQKDYKPGENEGYETEILDRYNHGETYNADSIKFNKDKIFHTSTGRVVYGGGGIMPDIFVPNDTTGITGYYLRVANAGLLQKFTFEYCDLNREHLKLAKNVNELLKLLPSDEVLRDAFVSYAAKNGIPAQWYYIYPSTPLILMQLKALIARDILGLPAYYQVINRRDNNIEEALRQLHQGNAAIPIKERQTDSDSTLISEADTFKSRRIIHAPLTNIPTYPVV